MKLKSPHLVALVGPLSNAVFSNTVSAVLDVFSITVASQEQWLGEPFGSPNLLREGTLFHYRAISTATVIEKEVLLAINRLVSVTSQLANGRSVLRFMTRNRRKQATKLDIKDSLVQLSIKKPKSTDKCRADLLESIRRISRILCCFEKHLDTFLHSESRKNIKSRPLAHASDLLGF